jgi:hypothetical protein
MTHSLTRSADSESDTCSTHAPDSSTIKGPVKKESEHEQNELSVVVVSSPLAESGAFLFCTLAYTSMCLSELMECFQNNPHSLANRSRQLCGCQYRRKVCIERYVISIRYEISIHMV